ncbi:MAG: hypothetical protein ACI379_03920 [Nocardioides sp.]|uniref:hypothetical protein n=1 Tax=Nocardioides sp. TaxID=35761 RepID=UPI003F0A25B3
MQDELGEQEEADVVVGALRAGLERLVDDLQQPQQVDEEERQERDRHDRLGLAAHVGEEQHDGDDGDQAGDHRLGRG